MKCDAGRVRTGLFRYRPNALRGMDRVPTNVCEIVEADLCVGCGGCAAYVPQSIRMKLNDYGAYTPILTENCTSAVDAINALEVCPFSSLAASEDDLAAQRFATQNGIEHNAEIGYYHKCFVGHVTSPQDRFASSSGGITTWLLKEMLNSGAVTSVACVFPSRAKNCLFEYKLVNSSGALWESRKSKYYPIELSRVIEDIRKESGRVALVGLPCFLKGIELLIRRDTGLKDKIAYRIGLFCGHLKSAQYTAFLARSCGLNESELLKVDYRSKINSQSAGDYRFEAHSCESGVPVMRMLRRKDTFAASWSYNLFMLGACDCCDDVVGELADVSVGDAWIPPYAADPLGSSIIVCRTSFFMEQLQRGISLGDIVLDEISPTRVVESQSGGFRHRREGLAYRLYLAQKLSVWRPGKRVKASRSNLDIFQRYVQRLRIRLRVLSREAFLEQKQTSGIKLFVKRLTPLVRRHQLAYFIRSAFYRVPLLLHRKLNLELSSKPVPTQDERSLATANSYSTRRQIDP